MMASLAQSFRLSLRLLLRQWRAGELRLLLLAVGIAVATTGAISQLTDRLQRSMGTQSAELLGADLLLRSQRPISEAWLAQAAQQGVATNRVLELPSMAIAGDKMRLVSLKGVTQDYPLRGGIRLQQQRNGVEKLVRGAPKRGEVWVTPVLLDYLALEVGDLLELGDSQFTITALIAFEPASSGGFAGFAPRIVINQQDLIGAGLLIEGSRVSYTTLFAADGATIAAYQLWLTPQLNPSQRLIGLNEGQPQVARTIERAESYLNIAALMALLMAGVAIALAARRYSERHFDTVAVLRALGVKQRPMMQLFFIQLLLIGGVAALFGSLLGYGAQTLMLMILGELTPALAPARWQPLLLGGLGGVVILLGFSLPALLRLGQVPAMRVLRRELTPLPISGWLVYGGGGVLITLLMWFHTADLSLTIVMVTLTLLLLLLFALLSERLLWLAQKWLPQRGGVWRLGMASLWRNRLLTVAQIVAFGLILVAVTVISLLRGELLQQWQQQLPQQAPNHFVINIQPHQREALVESFQSAKLPSPRLYQVVRGRLTHINGQLASGQLHDGELRHNSLRRELNITESAELPDDNGVIAGQWWADRGDHGHEKWISIEAEMAQELGLRLGDSLRFDVASVSLEAVIANIRSVKWDNLQPNFYIIFSPESLTGLPATYMASFWLPDSMGRFKSQLLETMPNLTLINVDQVLGQVRAIITRLTAAIEVVLLLIFIAAMVVLFAALQSTMDERQRQGAIMRTLGIDRCRLRQIISTEYMVLGALAGLFAAIGGILFTVTVQTQLLQLDFNPPWLLLPLLMLLGAGVIGLAGWLGNRRVVNLSPLQILRQLG
ncbi:FtsX-like permease family protein [Ectothiorhodospiraceae bacterium BW-2]|nr:FtsX-like permease family protein [Ectothiorhodospiraceae bacterium BW-2]